MSRIVKYNYGLWDQENNTGFVNIFDADFYICTRWCDGTLVEVLQLPESASAFFYTWYEKLKREGYSPSWNTDLIHDFWTEKDGVLFLDPLGIEINESSDRIRQLNASDSFLFQKSKIDNFQNLSLLGI